MDNQVNAGSQKISRWFDEGTFVQFGAGIRKNGEPEGLLCGYGAVEGKLVYAFLQDADRNSGALDDRGADKLSRLYETAVSNGAPVIGIFSSSGVNVYDGTCAMSAYGRFMKQVSKASGLIPQIAVIDGVCAGSSAAIAAMMDFIVFVKDTGKLYVTSPFILGGNTGTAEAGESSGLVAKTVETTGEAVTFVRQLVSILPSHAGSEPDENEIKDDINRKIVETTEVGQLISELADSGEFVRVYESYGPELITGFACLGGTLTGILAGDASVDEGRLTPCGARKAARMVSFCDCFDIPVITLVDTAGIKQDASSEKAPFAAELGRLSAAYAGATCPLITVYIGKAYGTGFVVMGSRALGADVVWSLPGATFGILSPEASVAFLDQEKLNLGTSREELIRDWTEKHASADVAAMDGSVDEIIPCRELRQRLISAIYMTSEKGRAVEFGKHDNMPL